MDKEMLPNIFDSFQQEGISTSRQLEGLGLGLSISKALTTMMSGTISAYSEGIGHGSTFTVTFPLLVNAPSALHSSKSKKFEAPPQKILLVEDDKSSSMVMSRFLRKLGHEVTAAFTVKEAKEAAEKNKFDMVISDLGLPDGSGFDLMKYLSTVHGLRGVCLSGYGMDEDFKKSEESGFDVHLIKPVDLGSLQSSISTVVNKIRETIL